MPPSSTPARRISSRRFHREILTAFVGLSLPGCRLARFDRGPVEDIAGRTLDGYRWAIKYLLACCRVAR